MKIKTQFRQGDVLIERVENVPSEKLKAQTENGRVILAHGEVTGHAHEIEEPKAASIAPLSNPFVLASDLQDAAAMTRHFLRLKKGSAVKHQEHSRIPLKRGGHRVTRQREYSPEAIRNVAD